MKKLSLAAVFCFFLGAGLGLAHTTAAPAGEAPTSGQALVKARCGGCHGLQRVNDLRGKKDAAWWAATVSRMVAKGTHLDEAQQALVVEYLAGGQ